MADNTHIVTRFDKDLTEIEGLLCQMADAVKAQILEASKALRNGDKEAAQIVADGDKKINALEKEIDEKAIRLIALRQPMAEDLRSAITTLKISANLERMGDYAKTLSFRVQHVEKFNGIKPPLKTISRMSEQIADMLDLVMEGYVLRDLEKSQSASDADDDINDAYDSLTRELLTYMMEDPRKIEACTNLTFIAKNLERSGDQVKNIAEQVHYLVTGELLED